MGLPLGSEAVLASQMMLGGLSCHDGPVWSLQFRLPGCSGEAGAML